MKQYSRNKGLTILLVGKRSEAIDGKRDANHVTYRARVSICRWYSALLRFDSLRIRSRRRKWKSKQKSWNGTLETRRVFLGNEDSRKPYSNGGSWKLGERKSKSAEKLLVKVDETSYPCRRSLIIADRYFKTLPEILFPPCFSIGFSIFSYFHILFYFVVSLLKNYDYVFLNLFLLIEYIWYFGIRSIIFFQVLIIPFFIFGLFRLFVTLVIQNRVFFLSFRFRSISEFQFHSINNRRDSINNRLIQR